MRFFGRNRDEAPAPARTRRPGPPPLLARSGRFALVVLFITGAFVGIGGRLWWLQYCIATHLGDEADKARRYSRPSFADRGQIRDSRDTVLAKSKEVWDVVADPYHFVRNEGEKLDEVALELSGLLRMPADKVAAVLKHDRREAGETADDGMPDADDDLGISSLLGAKPSPEGRPIMWTKLAVGVTNEVRDKVVEAMARLHVRNVMCSRRFEREYPRGKLASQLVGYVNKEGKAAMGVEKAFNFFLRGEDGWIDSQKNGKKMEVADRRIREIDPRDGYSVILTLDAVIQEAVEEELGKACEAYHPDWGIAIVSEAKTGRILALSNWPTFDLNDFADLKKSPLEAQKNRAVTDVYEPGSVFKIVSYSAAFQEGLITPDTLIDCGVSKRAPTFASYKGKSYRLAVDDEDLGVIDVRKAIAKSSNRAAAQIGMKVAEARGEQRLWQYMADFGFGSPTGLVTGTEVRGTLLKPSSWQWSQLAATITRMPMGHTVDVTALQTHFAMGVIASGGDLMAPMLVSRIVDKSGTTVLEYAPVVRKHVISKATAGTIGELLEGVVKNGTGKNAFIPGYDVAGKTGTTAILIKDEATGKVHYSDSRNVASFCGFFPAKNPQYVVSVIMRDPHGKGQSFGGAYSAPVFKSITERLIKWLKVPPSNPQELEALANRGARGRTAPKPAPEVAPTALPALNFDSL